jgi:hypothetical protein
VPASGLPTVTGHLYFNNQPCCEPAYKSPLIGTTMILTVLYCPSVPDLVGREYTVRSDLNGRYVVSGLPNDTVLKVRVMSHNPFERQLTVGKAADGNDFIVDGPPCAQTIVCPTTIQGGVLDGAGQPLDGVTITARIVTTAPLGEHLFSGTSSDTQVTTTVAGKYAITDAPTGATIQITASKPGYLTRQKSIIPVSRQAGPPTLNDVTFGKDGKTGALHPQSALVVEPASASPSPKASSGM